MFKIISKTLILTGFLFMSAFAFSLAESDTRNDEIDYERMFTILETIILNKEVICRDSSFSIFSGYRNDEIDYERMFTILETIILNKELSRDSSFSIFSGYRVD